MKDDYVRKADVVEVLDGDTFRCDVDLGFYARVRLSCRLININAVELREPGGTAARAYLAKLLSFGPVTIQSVKKDKYAGRFDANVWVQDGEVSRHVNTEMVLARYAVEWDGTGARPVVAVPAYRQ